LRCTLASHLLWVRAPVLRAPPAPCALLVDAAHRRTWFIVDALSSIPVELVDLFAPEVVDLGAMSTAPAEGVAMVSAPGRLLAAAASDEDGDLQMKVLRALRMVRLLRMLKLLNIQKYIDALEDHFGVNMQVLQIVKMILSLLYLMHLLGCFWFFVGNDPSAADTWLTAYDGGSGHDAPTDVQYLYSVYWALTTLTTVGYGDITPANNAERRYALVSLLIGALVFGYLLSTIGELFSNVDQNAVELDKKLTEVKDFARWHKMTPELAERVRRYFEYFYTRKSAMPEEDIIDNLAPSLHRDVVRHLLEKTAARIPMFSDEYCNYATDEFKLDVHPLLKPLVYEAAEVLVEKGSACENLFFLSKGNVGACAALDDRVLFPISDTGSFFGEHGLCNMRADLRYRALTRSEFFCLSRKDLYSLLEKYDGARSELAEFVFEDLLRHKMLRFWALKMVVREVREVHTRTGHALQLQVAWMKRQIIMLQNKRHDNHGSLEWLMPRVFGVTDSVTAPTPRADAPNSSRRPSARSELAPEHAAAVMGMMSQLEEERAKIARREATIERQLSAINTTLEQVLGKQTVAQFEA
jgi:CRP-like cAMP-binding protein